MNAPAYRRAAARRAMDPAAGFGQFDATHWHPPAGTRPRGAARVAGLAAAGVIVLTLLAVLMPMARADSGQSGADLPELFDTAACYQLVQDTGRMIAWARWELGAPESAVLVRFQEDTPAWIVDLTNRWVEDAYHWEITDDQVKQWSSEVEDRTASPPAGELTTPQTIAIWLRRIALQCHELHT
jgi:hypothetical protein